MLVHILVVTRPDSLPLIVAYQDRHAALTECKRLEAEIEQSGQEGFCVWIETQEAR